MEDVRDIDAELAKLQPLSDTTDIQQAHADLKEAQATGAPKHIIDSIQGYIDNYNQRVEDAQARRDVEKMGTGERLWKGAVAGAKDVGLHAKELARDILPIGHPGTGFEPEERAAQRAEVEKFERQSAPLLGTVPGFMGSIAGEAAATAPVAAVAGPAGRVLKGVGEALPLARAVVPPAAVLSSTLAGAGVGGLMAEPGNRLPQAALGGVVGGLTGAGQAATEWAARPGFKIDPAAKRLQELGVEGMTAGQLAPKSTVAHIEQLAENTPAGSVVKARREVLPRNLQERMLQEAHPPGFQSKLPPDASAWDRLNELGDEFHSRYNALLDTQPVPKGAIQEDLLRGAYGKSKFALSPSQRKMAVDIVTDEAAKLDDVNNMRTLADIKSNLAAERRLRAKTDPALAKHLGDMEKIADDHIERLMKADTNPEAYAQYKALGRAYRNYAILQKAAGRDMATDVPLTPDKVSMALRSNMTQGQFARGGGGTLRELAQAGEKVLAERPGSKTGASLNFVNAIPAVGQVDMGPWLLGRAGMFSTAHPELMLGQTAPQRVLQYSLAHPAVAPIVNQGLRTAVLRFLQGQPAGTEDTNAP